MLSSEVWLYNVDFVRAGDQAIHLIGDRAFPAAATRACNTLPVSHANSFIIPNFST